MLIKHIPRHRHKCIPCRCGLWCDAIEAVLAQIAHVDADDYRWLLAHLTGFYPMPRSRIREGTRPHHEVCGCAVIPLRQRAFRYVRREDHYVPRPARGRVELNIERCPIDADKRRWMVAHELGHLWDLIGRIEKGIKAPDERNEETVERAADAYARQWGFQSPTRTTQ